MCDRRKTSCRNINQTKRSTQTNSGAIGSRGTKDVVDNNVAVSIQRTIPVKTHNYNIMDIYNMTSNHPTSYVDGLYINQSMMELFNIMSFIDRKTYTVNNVVYWLDQYGLLCYHSDKHNQVKNTPFNHNGQYNINVDEYCKTHNLQRCEILTNKQRNDLCTWLVNHYKSTKWFDTVVYVYNSVSELC